MAVFVSSSTLYLVVLAFVQLQAEPFPLLRLVDLITFNVTFLKWASLMTMLEAVGGTFPFSARMTTAEAVVDELSEALSKVSITFDMSQAADMVGWL